MVGGVQSGLPGGDYHPVDFKVPVGPVFNFVDGKFLCFVLLLKKHFIFVMSFPVSGENGCFSVTNIEALFCIPWDSEMKI